MVCGLLDASDWEAALTVCATPMDSATQENKAMAKDTYGVVSLQYREGIVPYLNLITAQANLISSEVSYVNSLFQVLISKVALEKAMGNTPSK